MRAPFRNWPVDPWDDDEIPAFYRNGHDTPSVPTVDHDPDVEPAVPFGFQPARKQRSDRTLSRQARAARRHQ